MDDTIRWIQTYLSLVMYACPKNIEIDSNIMMTICDVFTQGVTHNHKASFVRLIMGPHGNTTIETNLCKSILTREVVVSKKIKYRNLNIVRILLG